MIPKAEVLQYIAPKIRVFEPEIEDMNRVELTEGYIEIGLKRAMETFFTGGDVYIENPSTGVREKLYMDDMLVKYRIYSMRDLTRRRFFTRSF